MDTFISILLELMEGFGTTLLLFVITLLLGIPLGFLICMCSMSKIKPLKYTTRGFVWIIRGSPLMLQILLVSFLPSIFNLMNKDITNFFNIKMSTLLFIFVALAFIINYACYFSEIFRGGFEAIQKGQYEACKVLGMTKFETFRYVILKQVIKNILPSLSNEIITLVKDTALAQILGVVDLLSSATHAVNTYVVLYPFIIAGGFYLLFNGLLTILFNKLEKKLAYYEV